MIAGVRLTQRRQTSVPFVTGTLQRKSAWPQRSFTGPTPAESLDAPSIVHDVLRSPGEPLDAATRGFMEPRFGYDFSHVRVHTDQKAANSARAVDALAYTVGSHLVFESGYYAPDTATGRQLLSHELTHSIQQSLISSETQHGSNLRLLRLGAAQGFGSQLAVGSPDSAAEVAADSASHQLGLGMNVSAFPSVGHVVQRQPAVRPQQHTRPEDFGITLAVVDHGATNVAGVARQRLDEIFRSLSATNLGVMQTSGITRIELHIIPYGKKLVDLPDFAHMRGTRTPDGRLWDDVDGSGGERFGATIKYSISEENLSGSRHGHGWAIGLGIVGGLGLGAGGAALGEHIGSSLQSGSGPGGIIGGIVGGVVGAGLGAAGGTLLGNLADESNSSGYARDFLPGHEGSHVIEDFSFTPAQRTKLQDLFNARTAARGPWLEPTDYTSSNLHEYWAQCSAAFFSRPYQDSYASTYTPAWLRTNDRGMYDLLVEVFGAPGAATAQNDVPQRAAA